MSRHPDAKAGAIDTLAAPAPRATAGSRLHRIGRRLSSLWTAEPVRQARAKAMLVLVGGLSVWHLAIYLVIAARRLRYPYALEWMEGGTLEHVARVLEGKPLYGPPSIDFTPFIYTPLYYWICAPVARVFGLQLPSLRLVSFLASLAVFVLLFRIVVMRTKNRLAGLVACGTFAACFEVCGGWFDLARVDSLAVCFLLSASWLMLSSTRHDAWVGVLLALSVLTKQSTAIAALALFAARFVTQTGRRRVLAASVFAGIVLPSTLIQDRLSAGYYSYYTIRLPSQHDWVGSMRMGFWRYDIFTHVPFAMVAALYLLTTRSNWRSMFELWGVAIGYGALGWISRMHTGGFVNVLMPTMVFLAWSMGEALSPAGSPARSDAARAPGEVNATSSPSLFWYTLCAFQLAWLLYLPGSHLPNKADRKGGDALVKYLRSIKGPILAPFDPLLPRLVGHTGNAHEQAVQDISYGTDKKQQQLVDESVKSALLKRRFAAIVLDGDWRPTELTAGYVLSPQEVHGSPSIEGARTHATQVWLRRDDGVPAKAPP